MPAVVMQCAILTYAMQVLAVSRVLCICTVCKKTACERWFRSETRLQVHFVCVKQKFYFKPLHKKESRLLVCNKHSQSTWACKTAQSTRIGLSPVSVASAQVCKRVEYISTRKAGALKHAPPGPGDETSPFPVRPDDIVLVRLLRTDGTGLVLGHVQAADWSRLLPLPARRNEA